MAPDGTRPPWDDRVMSLDDTSAVPPESISTYHARLPYGERVSAEPVADGRFFPFERPLTVVPLARPIVPEPPRNGEPGGGDCWRCVDPDAEVIWRDEHWNLR